MTTLDEMIEIIKSENPTLRIGDEELGYSELSAAEYNKKITEWAEARLEKEAKQNAAEQVVEAKIAAAEKLIALGIDPKALGL